MSQEATSHIASHPCARCWTDGHALHERLSVSGVLAPYRRQRGTGHAECAQTMGYMADSEEDAELTMQDGTSCAAK